MIIFMLFAAILCFYWYWRSTLLKHLPSIYAVFPFGHLWYLVHQISSGTAFTTNFFNFLQAMGKIFEKEGMFVVRRWPMKNVVVVCSADHAQVILSNRDEVRKSSMYATLRLVTGDGLLSSNGGDSYRYHKRIINSNFQKKMMERHQVIMSQHAALFCQKLESIEDGEAFAVIDYLLPCTFDIAVETAIGETINDEFNKDFTMMHYIRRFKDIWNERVVKPWLQIDWFFYAFTGLGKEFREIEIYARTLLEKVVRERREKIKKKINNLSNEEYSDEVERPCVLDFLLTHQLSHSSSLSDKEIFEELVTIIAAAFETTADTVMWALFLIGQSPDVQRKVHEELDHVFDSDTKREATYNDVNQLNYLQSVVKESLRLYPILPAIARELKNDLKIGGKLLPKGTEVAVLITAVNRDTNHYDNPEEFVPERFLPENSKNLNPFAFLPFSEGSRKCIGRAFAQRSVTTILCSMLRQFKIESLETRDSIQMTWEIHQRPILPIQFRLYRR